MELVLETYTGSKPKPKPKPSSANPNAVVEEPLDPDALRKKVLHKVGQFAVVPGTASGGGGGEQGSILH